MGLLDALKQYVSDSMPGGLLNPEWNKTNGQRLAEELNRGLLESTGINARDKRRAWERNKLDAVSGSSDTKASLNQQAYDSAMAMAGMAPMGLTVWHGSPHKFSKFDMSKIGTGEGAQAYGHGLYMAESPEVAAAYRSNLVKDPSFIERKTGRVISKESAEYADLLERQARMERNGYGAEFDKKFQIQEGALYKVDIPDEAVARMLDWDKKLSEQAPEVRDGLIAAMKKRGLPVDDAGVPLWVASDPTGEAIHASLSSKGNLNNAKGQAYGTSLLMESGIPGIRYLDQMSRGKGGTSNYVLFDDSLPRILETNGIPSGQAPWVAGEWQGLLGK